MATDDSLLRTIVLIAAIVLLAPFLFMMLAMPMMGMWGGGHMWGWDGAGVGLAWLLPWALFLLLFLGIGYLLYRAALGTDRKSDAALEELRVAYARGDISSEEFEERRERLERSE